MHYVHEEESYEFVETDLLEILEDCNRESYSNQVWSEQYM